MQIRRFNGLGRIGLRPCFENRGEVGEVNIVEVDKGAERWSPCLKAESRPGLLTRCLAGMC